MSKVNVKCEADNCNNILTDGEYMYCLKVHQSTFGGKVLCQSHQNEARINSLKHLYDKKDVMVF